MSNNLVWNVLAQNYSTWNIEPYNIFKHGSFRRDCITLLKEADNKENFADELNKVIGYYFWCKCEYEILVSPWPPTNDKKDARKIDIAYQLRMNFELLVDYLWNRRGELCE